MASRQIPFFQSPPVAGFSMVMGLAGLSLVWERLQGLQGLALRQGGSESMPTFTSGLALSLTSGLASAAALGALCVFVAMCGLYLRKWLTQPHAVLHEWQHPIHAGFFSAFSVSLILLASLALAEGLPGAPLLLGVGAGLHLLLMLLLLKSWVDHPGLLPQHITPVWFIPAVGNVVVPVVGVPLGWVQLSWWYFGIGMMFWGVLLVLVLARLLFVQPSLPPRLLPSLCILVAPPAVGLVSWLLLTGQMQTTLPLDAFSHVLMGLGLFFGAFLLLLLPRFARLGFSLSWWAFSFPVCAFAVALLSYLPHLGPSSGLAWVAWVAVLLATLLVLGLVLRTFLALFRAEPGFTEAPAQP